MADLSKIKLGEVTYDLKDAAARITIATVAADLASEVTRAKGAESTLQTNIDAEKTRAEGVEAGHETRISNLEARGRYLSTWDASTGKPGDYPTVPEGASYPYTYAYKAGDYYIISNVPASGALMPDGVSITKDSATSEWTIGSKAYTGSDTLVVGGQFLYSTTGWNYVATAKDVAWGNITGQLSAQTDLKNALDAKANQTITLAGLDLSANRSTVDIQTALGLEDLAYSASASGSYTPEGSISAVAFTPSGTVTLKDFGTASASATLTTVSYQPAGTVTGSVTAAGDITVVLDQTSTDINSKGAYTPGGAIKVDGADGTVLKGGSITVTIKDAGTATAVTDLEYENYTPEGAVSASVSITALIGATFQKVDAGTAGAVVISGTIDTPVITVDTTSTAAFVQTLTPGSVDAASFTEGTLTPATISEGFFTANTTASWSGYAFTAASLTDATTSAFATSGVDATVGTGTESETLIFTVASTANAVTDRGTFTASTINWGTFNGGSAASIDTTKFSGGSWNNGTFSAQKLPVVGTTANALTNVSATASPIEFHGDSFMNNISTDSAIKTATFTGTAAAVKLKGAKYLKQEINAASFTGTTAALTFTGTAATISVDGKYDKASVNATSTKFTGSSASISASFAGTTATDGWVTGVTYDKTTTGSATFSGTSVSITPTFTGTAAVISVTPDTVTVE